MLELWGSQDFLTFAATAPVGLYIAERGNFVFVNHKFEQMTGYTQVELVNVNALNLVVPEDKAETRESATDMLKGKRRSPYEFRILHKDGKVRNIVASIAPIEWRGVRATLGCFLDLTEQKKAEEEAQSRLEQLETVAAISKLLAGPASLFVNLTRVLIVLGRVIGAELVTFRVPDEGTKALRLLASAGWPEIQHLVPYGEGITGAAYARRAEVLTLDYPSFPKASPEALALGVKCGFAIPIKVVGEPIGVLGLLSTNREHFNPERIRLLRIVCDEIGLLIQSARRAYDLPARAQGPGG